MNTYEVTLEFEAVTVTVKANDEDEALTIAAENAECPEVDYFMSYVETASEGDDDNEDDDEDYGEDDEPMEET